MKLTLITSLLSLSTALPLNIQPGSKEVFPRAILKALPARPLPAVTPVKLGARPQRMNVSSQSGNGHANGKSSGSGQGNGHGNVYGNGHGNGSGTVKPPSIGKSPEPAKASAYIQGPGTIRMNNHDRQDPSHTITMHSRGPEYMKVEGKAAVTSSSENQGDGGGSSAQGNHKLTAALHNEPGSRGCIECHFPGQDPVKVKAGSGHSVIVKAVNRNPHLGPAKISVTQDGPGSNSAAASNHPY